jgi:polysaccharide deacetylase family protein (PEP-CTERM system associated)
MSNDQKKTCLLTFDIEEWFQVENLKGAISREEWEEKSSTVQKNTACILDLLKKFNIKATFFILGWVAERQPDLVKYIYTQGHEVACHGYGHERANQLKGDDALRDITKSKNILKKIIGEEIVGYRAPNFSISDNILEHLKELNFVYDSSYNPFSLNRRYGSISGSLSKVGEGCYLTEKGIYEIPLSSHSFYNLPIPIGGGAYFRIFPFWLFKSLINRKLQNDPVLNFYLHPWEFEPKQERVKNIRLNYRIRHYYGLKNTEKKLEKLILFLKGLDCEFLTIHQYVVRVMGKYRILGFK